MLDVFLTQVEKGVYHEFLSSLIKSYYQGQLQKSYLQDSVPYSELASENSWETVTGNFWAVQSTII